MSIYFDQGTKIVSLKYAGASTIDALFYTDDVLPSSDAIVNKLNERFEGNLVVRALHSDQTVEHDSRHREKGYELYDLGCPYVADKTYFHVLLACKASGSIEEMPFDWQDELVENAFEPYSFNDLAKECTSFARRDEEEGLVLFTFCEHRHSNIITVASQVANAVGQSVEAISDAFEGFRDQIINTRWLADNYRGDQ